MNKSRVLSKGYELRFSIKNDVDENLAKFSFKNNLTLLRQTFLQSLHAERKVILDNNQSLSLREMEVLIWLHRGKNARDIAQILEVADVTINKHIMHIKKKMECYSYFQLGEKFSKLICHSKELISYFEGKN